MKITLDVGGSKTRGFLYDGDAAEKFEIVGGFGIPYDSEEILEGLYLALQERFSSQSDEVTAVAVNLGGKNKEQIRKTVRAVFKNAEICVYRESEKKIPFEILCIFQADVLIMAGTGCIGFAQGKDGGFVFGGWGKDFGDEGSGYYIGCTAVKRAYKELDGHTDGLSMLTKRLLGEKEPFRFADADEYCAARDEVRMRVPKTREGIAGLTKTVVDCARMGCPSAQEIISENGRQIRDLIRFAARRAGIISPKVVVNGGITNFKELWQDELKEFDEVIYTNDGIDRALKNIVEEL